MKIRDELKWPSETGTVGQVLVERITKDGKISHTFEDDPADLERMTEEEKSAIFEEDELISDTIIRIGTIYLQMPFLYNERQIKRFKNYSKMAKQLGAFLDKWDNFICELKASRLEKGNK